MILEWYANGTVADSITVPIKNIVPDHAVKSEFAVSGDKLGVNREPMWARSGTFNLYLESAADDVSLSRVSFSFAYGHTTLVFSPSVSIDTTGAAGVGISFGLGTSEADFRSGYIKSNDTKWYQ